MRTMNSASTVIDALEHRIVAGRDGVEGERAHAGPVEHPLDDDDAADQAAELQADIGDERNRRVAQGVLVEHDAVAAAPWSAPP